MPATVLKRNQEQPVHAASVKQTVRVDRDDLLAGFKLRVNGEANVTVAGTAVVDGPAYYLGDVALKTASFDLLRLPGIYWYRFGQIFSGLAGSKLDVAAGTGVKPFNILLSIPEKMLRVFVEQISYLPAWVYDELFFEVNFGALSDLYTGGTATLQNLSCELIKEALADVASGIIQNPGKFAVNRTDLLEKQVTATTPNFRLELTPGRAKRAILLRCTDAGVDSNAIINSLSLKRGSGEVIVDTISWNALRDHNQDVYRIAMPTGWAVLDFAEDKDISEILDATGVDKIAVEANVTIGGGTTMIRAVEVDLQPSGL